MKGRPVSNNQLLHRIRRHVARQVVAYIALVFALTGTATAASMMITGKSIVNGSVTGVDIRNGSLQAAELSAKARASLRGQNGAAGAAGVKGDTGADGAQGVPGTPGTNGAPGLNGADGVDAPISYAQFYGQMPNDNSSTVAPGTAVAFPQDGPGTGTDITRLGADSFNLAEIGTYLVQFQVSITEAGQLVMTIDGDEQYYTNAGRAVGTAQIVGMALIETTFADSVLTIRNPADNSTALTVTPLAGGTEPVSASLVIQRLS